jgi:hypothetical protein
MAVSVLVLYTSGQIGSTYGEYNTSLQQSSSIELCSVFPGQIEQLLSELSGHIHRIIELKSSLAGYSTAGDYSTPTDIAALSADELNQEADLVTAQISSANSAIAAIDAQLSTNSGIWQQILQEASIAAAILNQARGYMLTLEPNCLEIRDMQSFQQIQLNASQSGVLSEALKDAYNEIVDYLSSIHAAGSVLPEGNPDRSLLRQGDTLFPAGSPLLAFVSKAYEVQPDISTELQAVYDQLNGDLTSERSILSAAVGNLQNQQLEIADAQAKLQEKEMQEKEDAKVKQDLESSIEDKAVDTIDANAGVTVPVVQEAGKPVEETPENGAAPDAAASGNESPVPSQAPATEAVQDKPEIDNTVQEPPAAAPVPVTETSKGGDE